MAHLHSLTAWFSIILVWHADTLVSACDATLRQPNVGKSYLRVADKAQADDILVFLGVGLSEEDAAGVIV